MTCCLTYYEDKYPIQIEYQTIRVLSHSVVLQFLLLSN